MTKLKLKGEDWMMTENDVDRFIKRIMSSLERNGLAAGTQIDVALEGSWEMFVYVPMATASWTTVRKRMKKVCEELNLDQHLLSTCDHNMIIHCGDTIRYHRFCITNMYAPEDVLDRYGEYLERIAKGVPPPPPEPEPFSEPWRHGHHEDPDGTVYDEGVILPKYDPDGSDTAIICLSPEFLVDHQEDDGFGEIRDYNPYYAKKFLSHPIKKVKILYGHQGADKSKNLWVVWKLDSIDVEFGTGNAPETSPYRENGTLKTRADYGTDAPIKSFVIHGSGWIDGMKGKYIPDWAK